MNDKQSGIKPWAAGPLELIRHGEDHLMGGGDFDKRMALISFDNAIEVSIATFLNLHPSQRGGREIPRKSKEEWQANYHKKLEFLEWFSNETSQSLAVTIDEILFYHTLRNELYHSGNGFVPEETHLNAIRSAAYCVFEILFQLDAESFLARAGSEVVARNNELTAQSRFMAAYIALEKSLMASLRWMEPGKEWTRYSFSVAWEAFGKHVDLKHLKAAATISAAIAIRGGVAHGKSLNVSEVELLELAKGLDEVCAFVGNYPVSIDLLAELKRRYPTWLKAEVCGVRIIQKSGRSYLETTTNRVAGDVRDERVERMDLSFIDEGSSPYDTELMFNPSQTAEENARKFVDELGPRSLLTITDLFREDAHAEILAISEK